MVNLEKSIDAPLLGLLAEEMQRAKTPSSRRLLIDTYRRFEGQLSPPARKVARALLGLEVSTDAEITRSVEEMLDWARKNVAAAASLSKV